MTLVNETSDGKNIENTKRKRYQFAMTQRYATVSNEGHASSMHRIDELREREREETSDVKNFSNFSNAHS